MYSLIMKCYLILIDDELILLNITGAHKCIHENLTNAIVQLKTTYSCLQTDLV